ncbi:MAG TPA: bifunctional riboflavin kinase/FAD synthetase [Casimicrobiaceae bacterium]|nr:bifunctional riboflavin kinase/FAD synthetase [Casimicrobiaceae bacterium]
MQLFRGLPDSAERHRPIALTIGNFDGVHRGHQAMLARLSEAAEDLALPSAILTFDPHPREFFAPGAAPPRLSTLRSKLEQFAAHGIAEVHVARFNAALAALSAERFIEDVLVRRLGTRWVLVGNDFRFGRGRSGDLALLRRAATTFSVEAMPTVVVDGERASSTAIRGALAAGELDHAARLLGRPYSIGGKVVHGDKLGRNLGFPTANIVLRHPPPLTGVFAVRVHGLGGAARAGAASLGVRPTVKAGAKPLLEVFVFDFDEAVYGRRVVVEFLCKLRDEERYADLDTLTRQIRADVAQAREYFATGSSTAR